GEGGGGAGDGPREGGTARIRILRWLLALLFVAGGVTKLIGVASAVAGFEHFGYPPWFRLLIGALETLGGIGLVLPALVRPAAAGAARLIVWGPLRGGRGGGFPGPPGGGWGRPSFVPLPRN